MRNVRFIGMSVRWARIDFDAEHASSGIEAVASPARTPAANDLPPPVERPSKRASMPNVKPTGPPPADGPSVVVPRKKRCVRWL